MIRCVICDQMVTSKRGLAFHLKKHNIESVEDYLNMFPEEKELILPTNKELLTCPICGKSNMKQLTQHLTWKHHMSRSEFEKLYPDQQLFIPEISERCKRAVTISNEHLAHNMKENPEKYKESRMRAARTRKERYPDIAKRISNKLREIGVYDRLSETTKKKWQDDDYRKMQSDKCKKQHENGLTEIVMEKSYNRNHVKIETINGKEYRFRSSFELRFAKILNEFGLEFEYESLEIQYFYKGKFHVYYPDFVIPNTNIVFEVKPYFRIQDIRNQIKQRYSIEQGYDFRYITELELDNPYIINLKGCF